MNQNLALTTFAQNVGNNRPGIKARKIAVTQFNRALSEGRSRRFWNRLMGRSSQLQSSDRAPSLTATRNSRIVHVPLTQIIGSEGRCEDFDADFRPLKSHNQERWVGIASARLMGVTLPPVELVQEGDGYYVRDGNHRISVARAMGQMEIEARIVN